MKFTKRDLEVICAALNNALDWQEDLGEANNHIPAERKKCMARIRSYMRVRTKIRLSYQISADKGATNG